MPQHRPVTLPTTPRVSVVMGVYNCAATLRRALDSIAAQTEPSWQLVVCDDGSTDDTLSVLEEFAGSRPGQVVVLKNEENLGLAPTLNRCIARARGEYLARMDGDDECDPERFALQAEYLDTRPEVSFVSSALTLFDEHGAWGATRPSPTPQVKDFLRGNPYGHGAVMVRKEHLVEVGLYAEDNARWRVEDYDLWLRMHLVGRVGANLQQPLYALRDDRGAAARRSLPARINEARVIISAARASRRPVQGLLRAGGVLLLGLLPTPVYQTVRRRWRRMRMDATH